MAKGNFPGKPVLMIDDEPSWLRAVKILLERHLGIHHVVTCSDSREATRLLDEQTYSLLLLDLTMPHRSGVDVLTEAAERCPSMPVIILTGRNEIDLAVDCMKRGAYDYFVKTVEDDRLVTAVRNALELAELRQENSRLQESFLDEELQHPEAFAEFITGSDEMRRVFRYAEAIAESRQPVLISGETGTGKELMARALHRLSAAGGPFVAVNIAGLDDHVFSDTLFGHVPGAFTGASTKRSGLVAEASGGVLFLDEIGDLDLASQVKLLRLLQEGEYFALGDDKPRRHRARIIVATNLDLVERIDRGLFRRDLYYRLKTHQIHLPALRERGGDLALLLRHFLRRACAEAGCAIPGCDAALLQLQGYPFPGNVRELEGLVHDAIRRSAGPELVVEVPGGSAQVAQPLAGGQPPLAEFNLDGPLPTLEEADRMLVDEAMRRSDGIITQAARMLGISRPALSKRLKKQNAPE